MKALKVIGKCLKKAAVELTIAANLLEAEWVSSKRGKK
jgi:hypothetical protein